MTMKQAIMSDQSQPREGRSIQECPICGAVQPLSARTCSICGAVLPGERTPILPQEAVERPDKAAKRPRYDPAVGDDDLYTGDLSGRLWRLMLVGAVVLAMGIGLGIGLLIARWNDDDGSDGQNAFVESLAGTATAQGNMAERDAADTMLQSSTAPPTSTPRGGGTPTVDMFMVMPTVTPLPPTATATPTPGPCYQTAQTGDTVLGMAMRCGHRDMAIIDTILEINGMRSPEELQLGQTLEIPWPTPTPGPPTEVPSEEAVDGAAGEETSLAVPTSTTGAERVNEFGTPDALAYYQSIEPTLRPGLAWHQVAAGDTIMGIAYMYEASVETLSQINPEIPFRQCDYGLQYGGENCSVMLYEGQRLRVPVPIPTSTPTPTPHGTFTPTPTATPTFNAPYPLRPEDGRRFMRDEIVTLRWGSTGTLAEGQQYIVRVLDLESDEEHVAFSSETLFQLPDGWQPSDGERHTFEWMVSVGVVDTQQRVTSEDYLTEPRRFTWESR